MEVYKSGKPHFLCRSLLLSTTVLNNTVNLVYIHSYSLAQENVIFQIGISRNIKCNDSIGFNKLGHI